MRMFRSGPDVVEAVQITNATFDAPYPNPQHIPGALYDPIRRVVKIDTPQGLTTGSVGDWIIRAPSGRLSICKSDVFARMHEPAPATVLPFHRR